MDADVRKLKKLVKFMRSEGVLALKWGETELSLSPHALFPKRNRKSIQDDKLPEAKTYTEEDALFWSSGGISEAAN